MKQKMGSIVVLLVALALVALIAVPLLYPQPLSVETASVTRGALLVTVDGEGKTRVKDRYTVAAPVAGRLTRIQLRRGDQVNQGELIARIAPMPLAPLAWNCLWSRRRYPA